MKISEALRDDLISNLMNRLRAQGREHDVATYDTVCDVVNALEVDKKYLKYLAALLGVGERFVVGTTSSSDQEQRRLHLQFFAPDGTPTSKWPAPGVNNGPYTSIEIFLTHDYVHSPITVEEQQLERLNFLFPGNNFIPLDLNKIKEVLGVKS